MDSPSDDYATTTKDIFGDISSEEEEDEKSNEGDEDEKSNEGDEEDENSNEGDEDEEEEYRGVEREDVDEENENEENENENLEQEDDEEDEEKDQEEKREYEDEDEEEKEERASDQADSDENEAKQEENGEMEDNEDEENEKMDESSVREEDEEMPSLALNLDEEQEEELVIPETRIDVEVPRIVADLGKDIHFVKLPNFLSVDTHPYDPSWYDEEGFDDEEGGYDDEGRARIKLKVENTIRWRTVADEDGNMRKESNAKFIRWSDGSMSLHLGSEIFDIHKQNLMTGDNNHLFIRQGTGLQGQAVFRTKLTFRPHSTDSFTHRKMTMSLADRSQKTQKIRVLPTVGTDPEARRSEMIKKEEDRLKASIRRENKMRRVRESANARGPSASYLEPDIDDEDDEGGISLSAIKKKYKKGQGIMSNVYTDSEEEGESDDDFDKKKEKKKAKIVESSEEED